MSPLTDTKLKKTSKKSITSSGCWLCTLSHVHSAAAILVRKLKTTTNIQCGHCYSKSYHQTWLGHCDISSVSIAMLLSWQRWLGHHQVDFLQSGNCWQWSLTTCSRYCSCSSSYDRLLQKSWMIATPLCSIVCDSQSFHNAEGLIICLIVTPLGSFVSNVIGSLRRRNIVFKFAVQNWSSPFWSLKADGPTCGRLGGWSGAGLSMAATIRFLVLAEICESKSAIVTSSSERYHTCIPSFLLVTAEIFASGYPSSCVINWKSLSGASTAKGAVIQAFR